MSLKDFQDLYVGSILHRTGIIKDQLEAGLYLLKRVGFYLRKVATAKRACATELSKCSDHETEKLDRLQKDRMGNHVAAYQQVQNVVIQMAATEQKYAMNLLDRVAEPLLSWHKEAELRLKRLIQGEEKLESGMAALRARLKSERLACIKSWSELKQAYTDWQRALSMAETKKIEKAEKNFLTKRERCQKQFAKYELSVDAGNVEQRNYWLRELPNIVTQYEQLEVERMTELQLRLDDLRRVQSEYSEPFPTLLKLMDCSLNVIDGKAELASFVETARLTAGKPEPPPHFVDGLPTEARSLMEDVPVEKLGQLLNQDPLQLAAQREVQQAKEAGAISADSMYMSSSTHAPSSITPASPSSSVSSPNAPSPSASTSSLDPFNRAADPPATFVRSLYDFSSDDPDDLTFTINTIIKVTLKGEDDELAAEVENGGPDAIAEPRWWRGQRLENIGKSSDGTFPSNYVRLCQVDKDLTLRHLLELPSGVRVFREFLKTEYAAENVEFWTRVEEYRKECINFLTSDGTLSGSGHATLLAAAQSIASEYIGEQAASQVNISSATLKLTQDRLAQLPESLSLNLFDEAASEILKMMQADSFARFKRHELFEKYLASGQTATTNK